MRLVAGDVPGDVVRAPGPPPLPMTSARLGTGLDGDIGHPDIEPQNTMDNRSISGRDVGIDFEGTTTATTPT
ncbi:MAG: hypothetical protein ACOCR6_01355 [archaeon]